MTHQSRSSAYSSRHTSRGPSPSLQTRRAEGGSRARRKSGGQTESPGSPPEGPAAASTPQRRASTSARCTRVSSDWEVREGVGGPVARCPSRASRRSSPRRWMGGAETTGREAGTGVFAAHAGDSLLLGCALTCRVERDGDLLAFARRAWAYRAGRRRVGAGPAGDGERRRRCRGCRRGRAARGARRHPAR